MSQSKWTTEVDGPPDNLLQSKWTLSEEILSRVFFPTSVPARCYKMAAMLSLVSNLNEMEGESDCEAGGECIIHEEHCTEDEEAVFRRVYDYLMEKKYPDGLSKDVK